MKKNLNSTIDTSLLARLPTLDQQIEKQRRIVAHLKIDGKRRQEGHSVESRKLEILLAKREASTCKPTPETKVHTTKKHSPFDTKVLPSQTHLGATIGETKAAKALAALKTEMTKFDTKELIADKQAKAEREALHLVQVGADADKVKALVKTAIAGMVDPTDRKSFLSTLLTAACAVSKAPIKALVAVENMSFGKKAKAVQAKVDPYFAALQARLQGKAL